MSAQLICIILVIIAVIIALAYVFILATLRESNSPVTGSARSKLEARVITILEDILGAKFNQAHPKWLRDPATGTKLELDGYNEPLRIALEVQGPGHIKPIPGESYSRYTKRVARDILKRELCAKHNVTLITVDYRITMQSMRAYLQSRLWDARAIAQRPYNYIAPLSMTPWARDT